MRCYLLGACIFSVMLKLPETQMLDGDGQPMTYHLRGLEDEVDRQLALAMYAQALTERAAPTVTDALEAAGPVLRRKMLKGWLSTVQSYQVIQALQQLCMPGARHQRPGCGSCGQGELAAAHRGSCASRHVRPATARLVIG